MDTVDRTTRSKIMRSVPQRGTSPEIRLRKALHRRGFRYRVNDKRLPGSPDIVFPRYHAVLSVHGCFWHRHGCKYTTTPSTRKEFWEAKFKANIERDKRNEEKLKELGWRVLVVWECEIKNSLKSGLIERVERFLVGKG
ncbi:very short patch repair endonuclease [Desulfoplanes sp. PS50]